MGHIINPITFRIGQKNTGVRWVGNWIVNKQNYVYYLRNIFNDYYIINYILGFFKFLKRYPRQLSFTGFSKKIQKKFGNRKFKKKVSCFFSLIREQSLVISHVKILRIFSLNLLKIGIFFFDTRFIVKLKSFITDKLYYSIVDRKLFRQRIRDENIIRSSVSEEAKRDVRKKERYGRRRYLKLLELRDFGRIQRYHYRRWFEFKYTKKQTIRFLSVVGRIRSRKVYHRIFGNYKQFISNSLSLYSIYKNLIWYILIFRNFYNKKRNNNDVLSKFLNKSYFMKYKYNTYLNHVRTNYMNVYKIKFNYLGLKNVNPMFYFYNKSLKKFRSKLFFILFKRLRLLIFLIKKYSLVLEKALNVANKNVIASLIYERSLKRYALCNSLLSFVYFEFNNLRIFYIKNNRFFNYLRIVRKNIKVKLREYTKFFLSMTSFFPMKFTRIKRMKNKKKPFVKRLLFFKQFGYFSKYFYVYIKNINYIKKFNKLFNIFKIFFLIFVKNIDFFFFKYMRRFYFKLFFYIIYIMLCLLNFIKNYFSFFSFFKRRLLNLHRNIFILDYLKNKILYYKYNFNILFNLLLKLKKQKFLHKKRLFSFNYLYSLRFYLFYIYSLIFKTSAFFSNYNYNIDFNYYAINNKGVTPSIIINYISKLLKNRYPIWIILKNIIKDLRKNIIHISGFRIICAGRLTKKQRAAYIIRGAGKASLGTVQANVEYAADFVVLRFGKVGFKVWIASSKNFIPFFYKIEYNFFINN